MAQPVDAFGRPAAVPWWIHETDRRWLLACRRFLPTMIVGEVPVPIRPLDWTSDSASPRPHEIAAVPSVWFWELDRCDFARVLRQIIRLRRVNPRALHLGAANDSCQQVRLAAQEIGLAVIVQRPEQVPRLSHAVNTYFARSTSHLD